MKVLTRNFKKHKNENNFKAVLSLFQENLFSEWIIGTGSACLYYCGYEVKETNANIVEPVD